MAEPTTEDELEQEAIGTLLEWLDDYTSPWHDGHQRKIIIQRADMSAAHPDLLVEVATVADRELVRSPRRYQISINVKEITT